MSRREDLARRTVWLWLVAVPTTVLAYGLVLLVTGFVACGLSGCSGGRFGLSFAPQQAQVGALVAGLVLALLGARRWGARARVGAAVVAVVGGALAALVLLGLGPNGCPVGQVRATTAPEAFDAGSATCSSDPDAVSG